MAAVIALPNKLRKHKVHPQLIRVGRDMTVMIGDYIGCVFATTGRRYLSDLT